MYTKNKFKNKVVIVTGASSGIGYAIALKLAKLEATLVIAARRADKLDELEILIGECKTQVLSFTVDISVRSEVDKMVKETIEKFGRIDVLIANAGQYIQADILHANHVYFEQSMAVNFQGTFYCVKSVLPHMTNRQSGNIVIINSLDAKKGIVGDGPYVAAKCALDGFADVLRQEVERNGGDNYFRFSCSF